MAAAEKPGRPQTLDDPQGRSHTANHRASRPASFVHVYTAGLRWETEPMVKALAQDAAPTTPLHRLPLVCPLEESPGGHHTLWKALWQAACLLHPEFSPAQWRPRVRRLARVARALIQAEETDVPGPGAHESAQAVV